MCMEQKSSFLFRLTTTAKIQLKGKGSNAFFPLNVSLNVVIVQSNRFSYSWSLAHTHTGGITFEGFVYFGETGVCLVLS